MATAEKRRTVEVLRKGKWVKTAGLSKLRKDEHFRMFEPDGTPVVVNSISEFVALSKGYKVDGVGAVDVLTTVPIKEGK